MTAAAVKTAGALAALVSARPSQVSMPVRRSAIGWPSTNTVAQFMVDDQLPDQRVYTADEWKHGLRCSAGTPVAWMAAPVDEIEAYTPEGRRFPAVRRHLRDVP